MLQDDFDHFPNESIVIPERVQAVINHMKSLGLKNKCGVYKVDSDYYDWTLEQRASVLKAPSIHHLCKTIVFENTRIKKDPSEEFLDPLNPQFIVVLVQYTDKINAQKLRDVVRAWNQDKIAKKYYNWRLASAEKALELTGFVNNAVTPFGILETRLPLLMTTGMNQLNPSIVYMGAGDVDWKLSVPVKELIEKLNVKVVDLTETTSIVTDE
jgi:prolyl-tRNA editing enzyme YbaK/EbsC (Cys-tRNA(Pro) deacylase)